MGTERPGPPRAPHDEEVIARYLAGETTGQLADRYGVTRQSIHARLARSGVTKDDQIAAVDARVRTLVERHYTTAEIVEAIGIGRERVKASIERQGLAGARARRMTARQIAEAAERVAQGETIKAVAHDSHVSQCTLSNYLEEAGYRRKLDYQGRRKRGEAKRERGQRLSG